MGQSWTLSRAAHPHAALLLLPHAARIAGTMAHLAADCLGQEPHQLRERQVVGASG